MRDDRQVKIIGTIDPAEHVRQVPGRSFVPVNAAHDHDVALRVRGAAVEPQDRAAIDAGTDGRFGPTRQAMC